MSYNVLVQTVKNENKSKRRLIHEKAVENLRNNYYFSSYSNSFYAELYLGDEVLGKTLGSRCREIALAKVRYLEQFLFKSGSNIGGTPNYLTRFSCFATVVTDENIGSFSDDDINKFIAFFKHSCNINIINHSVYDVENVKTLAMTFCINKKSKKIISHMISFMLLMLRSKSMVNTISQLDGKLFYKFFYGKDVEKFIAALLGNQDSLCVSYSDLLYLSEFFLNYIYGSKFLLSQSESSYRYNGPLSAIKSVNIANYYDIFIRMLPKNLIDISKLKDEYLRHNSKMAGAWILALTDNFLKDERLISNDNSI